MRKNMRLSALSLVTSALLIGCGSSSSDNSGVSSSTADTLTGYFIDAPVAGLSYKTDSGLTGTTDINGKFQYKKGEKVHFSLGKLSFGDAKPTVDGLVSPKELTQNQELVTLILRTLQALDSDNDPSNGITISDDVITALKNMADKKEISSFTKDEDILKIDDELTALLDEDFDGEIDVDKDSAHQHFENSLDKWEKGEKPDHKDNGKSEEEHGKGNGQGHGKGQGGKDEGGHGSENKFDISDTPKSELTDGVKYTLAYMGNEERLAYDIYMTLYNYHNENGTEIKQFKNIASRSEVKHIGIVQDIVRKYDINISNLTGVTPVADKNIEQKDMPMGEYDIEAIQKLYDDLYAKGVKSPKDALEVGCMVEVVDVNDLDKYIKQAEESNASDVVSGFNILRNGSYNHYWAFDKGLKNLGIENGCASLGAEYDKDYPQNEHGGNGQGQGQGNGQGHGRQ